MRKDVLLEFEYFPFIGSLYNGKLSPFEFQSSAVVSPRSARSRINRSVTSAWSDGRTDGYSHICLSIRLYVYFALEWHSPTRYRYKPRFFLSLSHTDTHSPSVLCARMRQRRATLFDFYGDVFQVTDSISSFPFPANLSVNAKPHSECLLPLSPFLAISTTVLSAFVCLEKGGHCCT